MHQLVFVTALLLVGCTYKGVSVEFALRNADTTNTNYAMTCGSSGVVSMSPLAYTANQIWEWWPNENVGIDMDTNHRNLRCVSQNTCLHSMGCPNSGSCNQAVDLQTCDETDLSQRWQWMTSDHSPLNGLSVKNLDNKALVFNQGASEGDVHSVTFNAASHSQAWEQIDMSTTTTTSTTTGSTIRIHTCDDSDAPTANTISLRINDGAWQVLDNPGNDRQRNQWDEYSLSVRPNKIELTNGGSDGWCLDNIEVDGLPITSNLPLWLDNPCTDTAYSGIPCAVSSTWMVGCVGNCAFGKTVSCHSMTEQCGASYRVKVVDGLYESQTKGPRIRVSDVSNSCINPKWVMVDLGDIVKVDLVRYTTLNGQSWCGLSARVSNVSDSGSFAIVWSQSDTWTRVYGQGATVEPIPMMFDTPAVFRYLKVFTGRGDQSTWMSWREIEAYCCSCDPSQQVCLDLAAPY